MNNLLLFAAVAVAATSPAAAGQLPTAMKAVVLHHYGGPEALQYENAPVPQPKANQLLVRVIAAGVNPVDAQICSGKFAQFFKSKLPLIPGYDIAGEVAKVGSNNSRFKPGDAVYAYIPIPEGGGYAQYALATASQAAPKPQTISFAQAAAVPVAALTAWQALVDTAHLEKGQTVLIHGGSGGVGTFAVQIAKVRGARVIATASAANQAFLKELGADVTVDYRMQKFEDFAKNVDLVLDTIGGDTLARSYAVVKKGGMIVSLVARPDPDRLAEQGIYGSALSVDPNSAELTEIGKLIDERKIKVFITQTFPLSEAAKAHEQVATGHTRGKIVLQVASESGKE